MNVKQARLVYDAFCQTHEGCGTARWPEYVLNFETKDKMSVFMVDIYQIPLQLNTGKKNHDNFTFLIREPYNIYYFQELKDIPKRHISEKTLQMIQKSIRFITPDVPLACHWTFDTIALPQTYRNLEEFKDKIATVSGFYYSPASRRCETTSYDAWIYDVQNAVPPFTSIEECETACMKQ